MTTLMDATDAELVAEMARRGRVPRCRCQRWQTYLGAYDQDGYTWRCRGCLCSIAKCRCT
jgi:hypothetical protein